MDKLVTSISKPPKARKDDDFIDRMNSRYTCAILIVFGIVVSLSQWVGKPIVCWAPKEFADSWKKYVSNYCWINNTYYLHMSHQVPRAHEANEVVRILYYQWIPWMLVLQAVFFYFPSIVWHGLNSKAGVDCDDILCTAVKLEDAKLAERRNNLQKFVISQIHRFLDSKPENVRKWKNCISRFIDILLCRCFGNSTGTYLVVVYIFTKLLYLANIVGQALLLSRIFQMRFITYGVEYFNFYMHTDEPDFTDSPIFPRVTFCDMYIRRLGNLHRYTIQCVLPLNLFVEKMYLFMWFWMLLLFILTIVSILLWLLRMCCSRDQVLFVMNHLDLLPAREGAPTKEDVRVFVDTYLRQDGAFILRLIAHNTNTITSTEIIRNLYDNWQDKLEEKRDVKKKRGMELQEMGEMEPLTNVTTATAPPPDEVKQPL